MPTPEEIRAAFTLRGVNVTRYSEDVRRRATGLLETLAGKVYRYLATADLNGRVKREKAIRTIRGMAVEHYTAAQRIVEESMVELVRDESRHFKAVFGRGSGKQLLKREAQALVSKMFIDGVPLEDWLVGQSMELAQKIGRQIRLHPADGTAEQLSSKIFGRNTGRAVMTMTPSGKVVRTPVFQGDGLLQTARRYLNTVSKSAIHAASQAALMQAVGRSSTVEKLELSVILDRRTSQICNSRAGAIWMAASGDPAPESATSEPFPGPPPYHLNCRSMLIPFSSEVAPEIAFKEWISSLTAPQQRDILGTGVYNSMNKGTLDLNRVDVGVRPLTLEQLRDSY
jgi:hypothetical protein